MLNPTAILRRWMVLGVLLALALGFAIQTSASAAGSRVLMYDNDPQSGLANVGGWGFAPLHFTVVRGDPILFENPATNFRPHTATSITWGGSAFERTLESGTLFNSSPDQESLVTPGNSFTLDTGGLDAGQYVYYCTLHPWMVGTFTVIAR